MPAAGCGVDNVSHESSGTGRFSHAVQQVRVRSGAGMGTEDTSAAAAAVAVAVTHHDNT